MDPMGHALVVFHFLGAKMAPFQQWEPSPFFGAASWIGLRCRNGFCRDPQTLEIKTERILSGFWGPEPSRKDWLMRSIFCFSYLGVPAKLPSGTIYGPSLAEEHQDIRSRFESTWNYPPANWCGIMQFLSTDFFWSNISFVCSCFDYTRVSRIQRFRNRKFFSSRNQIFRCHVLIAQGGSRCS